MANSYYEGTGLLVFDGPPVITPVIRGLFGPYWQESNDGASVEHCIMIAARAESDDIGWRAIGKSLYDQKDLKLAISVDQHDDGGLIAALTQLGERYKVTDPAFKDLIDQLAGGDNEDADIDVLFRLARWFQDGHNLKEVTFEGSWRCDKTRLFEFGGNVMHVSEDFTLYGSTSETLAVIDGMQRAFDEGGVDVTAKVAKEVYQAVRQLVDGINDPLKRLGVMYALAGMLDDDKEK